MTAAFRVAAICIASIACAQQDASVLLSQAVAFARQGQPQQARDLLEKGRAGFPSDKRFPIELAGLAFAQKDLPSAAAHLREALRLDPSDAYANELLATVYLMQGSLEASLLHWNRINQPLLGAVREDPRLPLSPTLRARAVAVSAGQILTLDRLRATTANLDRLGAFASYRFELSPDADGRFALTLRTVDTSLIAGGWRTRLLSLAAALPYRALELDFVNLRRSALNVSSLWRWDPNKRRAAVSVAAPLRDNPALRYRLFFDARDERWNLSRTYRNADAPLTDVRVRRIEAGADLTIAFANRLEWTPGLRVSRGLYAGGDSSALFADYWSIRARNELQYPLFASPERRLRVDARAWLETGSVYRRTRSRLAAGAAEAQAVWGPFATDTQGVVRAAWSAGHISGGAALDQLFTLGMERDNDLWLRGHAGAFEGRKGNAPMGRSYTLGQIQFERSWLRLPLLNLWAGPFFDTGIAAYPSRNLGSQGWMYDTGIQATVAVAGSLRWVLVYGRDLRDGGGVFYTAVRRVKPRSPPR